MEQDNYKDSILIEQFLTGQLEGSDLASFERRLKEDKGFAKEMEIMRSMMDGIELNKLDNLKSVITGVENKLEKEDFFPKSPAVPNLEPEPKIIPMNPKKRTNWLAIAAGLAVLVAAFMWLNQEAKPSPQEAYAKFYKKDMDKLDNILDDLEGFGIGDPEKGKKDQLATALKLYETDEYQAAADSLVQYLAIFGNDPIASFYLGKAYMNLGDYGAAVEQLSPLIQLPDFPLVEQAKYALALNYSMLGTTEGNLNSVKIMNQLKESPDTEIKQLADSYIEFLK